MLVCIQSHICEHRSMSDSTWINQYLITYMDLLVYLYAYVFYMVTYRPVSVHTGLYLAIHRSMFEDTQSCLSAYRTISHHKLFCI